MNTVSKPLVAFALGISIVALAAPSLVQTGRDRGRDSVDHISASRAAAIRECSRRADREYPAWSQASMNIEVYDACMGEHGQPD